MTSTASFIKDFGPSIPWILAIGGLIYNNNKSNEREKRKEFRSEIDAIEKIVKDLVGKLSNYIKQPERDDNAKNLELEIKGLFRELDFKWDRLKKRQSGGTLGLYIDPCIQNLEDFYDHSTGQYFETAERIPADKMGEHIQGIYNRALTFMEALHSLFLKKFDGI